MTLKRWVLAVLAIAGCGASGWFGTTRALVSDPGLVAHWTLDADGTDVTLNGHDGAVHGAQPGEGVVDGALVFDGFDDEVVIQSSPLLTAVTAGPHSMSAWVRLDAFASTAPKFILDGSNFAAGGLLGDQRGFRLEESGRPVFKWVTTATSYRATASYPLALDEWYHLAGTFDGAIGRLFINGELSAQVASTGVPTVAPNWKIGNISDGGTGTGQFPGAIDDVRIYNRVLSDEEIAVLAGGDSLAPDGTCVAPLDEWSAVDIVVACTASDQDSGLADPAAASFNLATSVPPGVETDTASTNASEVCDNAGNCLTLGPFSGLKVDKKAPTIQIGAPSQTTYIIGQTVLASYTCSDAGAGVATCDGPVATGTQLPMSVVGQVPFDVVAADLVGNIATASSPYSVRYAICQDFDSSKAHRRGSTLPVRLALCDASGANLSSQGTVVTAVAVHVVSTQAPGPLEDSGNANPDMNFRFSGDRYIFNLSLRGFDEGTYALLFSAGQDPTLHSVTFQVR